MNIKLNVEQRSRADAISKGVHANIIELIEIEVLVANVEVQPPAASGGSAGTES